MLNVYHLKALTKEQADRLNAVGWDGAPEFTRYADITSFGKPEDVRVALDRGEYELVATVDTDDLDVAYEKTNHIDRNWTENDGVTVVKEGRVRSSSVGDVFQRNGRSFVVAPMGFEEIRTGYDKTPFYWKMRAVEDAKNTKKVGRGEILQSARKTGA